MTEQNYKEIEKYLLTKKLPFDILLEVKDHIIAQISEIQKRETWILEMHF